MDVVFYRLDRTVKEGKLYLNPKANLSALADMAGTNRTYASKAVCARYRNFKDYINTLRIENLLQDIHDDKCGWLDLDDEDDFANRYGFSNRRSMDRIDIVAESDDRSQTLFCDCRYRDSAVGLSVLDELEEKSTRVRAPGKRRYALFSKGGFTPELEACADERDATLVSLEDICWYR